MLGIQRHIDEAKESQAQQRMRNRYREGKMSNLLQLAIQAIEGKNQWYVGEKVTVATANGRQAYLRNDDCFIRLYTSDDRNDGLIVGWLDLGQGIWKIAQDAAANYASWAAKRRKEKKEMGKDDDKLMTLASKALAKYPALATRAQAAAELVRRGHIKPRIGGRFEVRSQSQADKYYIVDTEARTCTCYDYSHHAPEVCDGPMCKHRLAVLMLMKLQEAQAPDLARLHREERRIETRQAAMAAGVPVLL